MGDRDLSLEGVVIHHDRDSVYTSHDWLRQVLSIDRGRLSYAQHGARDNPWIESFWGRFKTENASVLWEAETLDEVVDIVGRQMAYYNRERRPWRCIIKLRRSSLGAGWSRGSRR